MANFPRFEYTEQEVRDAGEALAGTVLWDETRKDELTRLFAVANNWRDSHALPMHRMRHELMGFMRRQKVGGISAARLKRMRSIRRKLANQPTKLNRIQDLAGCRAIVPTIADVNGLVGNIRGQSRHKMFRESDYLNKPKPDGYRSHHLVFEYQGDGDEAAFNGRRVEIQVRTRLQHSWATAVEAVGLFRGENMKGGVGDADWLRLFQLMSMEFALAEGCLVDCAGDRKARVDEIRHLDEKLEAAKTLETLSQAVRYTDTYYRGQESRGGYYLIQYNHTTKTVSVKPYAGALSGAQSYDRAEMSDNRTGAITMNSVLVEVDKVENLKEAYPNYFGDVQLFRRNLREIVKGKEAQEYLLPPQETVPRAAKQAIDLSWFKRRIRW